MSWLVLFSLGFFVCFNLWDRLFPTRGICIVLLCIFLSGSERKLDKVVQ